MSKLNFVQIDKENEILCDTAASLWIPFIKEVNAHDGIIKTEAQILDGLQKRIAIQGKRKDMHFEIAFFHGTAIGIAMFAVDLGTVYGLLEKGYGTVMGFYIHPEYRRRGFGTEFWLHIEDMLRADGALNFYICPDSVIGVPFWMSVGFEDSGLMDPDDHKPIYIKRLMGLEEAFDCEIPDTKLLITELDTVQKMLDVLQELYDEQYELIHCLYSELEFMNSIICQCESFSTFLNEKDDSKDALKMIIGWLKMIALSADTALLNIFTLSDETACKNVDKINCMKQSLKDIKLKTENVMNDCQKYLVRETIQIKNIDKS